MRSTYRFSLTLLAAALVPLIAFAAGQERRPSRLVATGDVRRSLVS